MVVARSKGLIPLKVKNMAAKPSNIFGCLQPFTFRNKDMSMSEDEERHAWCGKHMKELEGDLRVSLAMKLIKSSTNHV